MQDFDGQAKLHRTLCRDRPTLRAGMARTIKDLRSARLLPPGLGLAKINWDETLRRWVRWFDALLESHPPPPACEVLWLETPSVLGSLATSAAAYLRLAPASDAFGTESDCAWPGLDHGSDDWSFDLSELRSFVPGDNELREDDDNLVPKALVASLSVSHALTLLLALQGLRQTHIQSYFKHATGVAVIMGPRSGGVMPIGQLRSSKWSPIRRAKPLPIVLSKVSADERMCLAQYQPRRFVALGGDLNGRDRAGQTALMNSAYSEAHEVRALLEAGADATLRCPNGESILHRFGAGDISTLRLLVRRGADPHAVDRGGRSVLDRLVRDGRCTARHIRFYESLGLRVESQGRVMTHAMRCVVTGGAINDGALSRRRSVLDHIIGEGHDVNARDEANRTPLWLTLEEYVADIETLHAEPESYLQDRVAELLLARGADPNARHPVGRLPFIPRGGTPLMVRRYDDSRLIKALLRHGANPFARCEERRTALDYARDRAAEPPRFGNHGAAECVAVLERAMNTNRRRRR